MHTVKRAFLLSLMSVLVVLGGCFLSDDNGSGTAGGATGTADFFHLAIVPNQVVTAATFKVQVIAESIDPTTPPNAPVVVDASGTSHTMALETLQWPGTATNSVSVYAADVPLLANQANSLKVVSGIKEIAFSITHKAALNIQHAANPVDLVTLLQTATTTDTTIDVIEVDYAEADLGAVIDNIGSNTVASPTTRTTWLTLRPGTGSMAWLRDYPGAGGTYRRPKLDFLQLNGVNFGSVTSDGGGYQYYAEPGHRIWFSNVTFRAQYDTAWDRETIITASYLPDIRVDPAEAQKVYFTDCLWSGTAPNAATQYVQLARDLRFISHRGDINQFGKVVLNVSAQDLRAVKTVAAPLDYTHNDGFQVWGPASDIAIVGIRVTSPTIAAYLQPFLFDRTFVPSYSQILVDTIVIEGASLAAPGAPTTVDRAQLAGVISNSRISNLSFPEQELAIRQDFIEPNGAFTPTNVRIHNIDVWGVGYSPAAPAAGVTYSSAYGTVGGNPADISGILNAVPALSGVTFSSIKVK